MRNTAVAMYSADTDAAGQWQAMAKVNSLLLLHTGLQPARLDLYLSQTLTGALIPCVLQRICRFSGPCSSSWRIGAVASEHTVACLSLLPRRA